AGIVRFKSRVAGTIKNLELLGSGELLDARLGLESFPHHLDGASARLLFTQNKVVVQDFSAGFADGNLRGVGDISLDKELKPSDLRFTVRIDDAQLRYPEDFPSRVSGTL